MYDRRKKLWFTLVLSLSLLLFTIVMYHTTPTSKSQLSFKEIHFSNITVIPSGFRVSKHYELEGDNGTYIAKIPASIAHLFDFQRFEQEVRPNDLLNIGFYQKALLSKPNMIYSIEGKQTYLHLDDTLSISSRDRWIMIGLMVLSAIIAVLSAISLYVIRKNS